jgi:hypothetical protein
MTMKDRVKELRRVPASELRANPKNWRRHPPAQKAALEGVLADIGFADVVIARETEDGLELIDGHLRQEVMGDQSIPVLIVDVTEEEADKMLLTLDPLAMMAHADTDQLLELLRDNPFESQAVFDMLEALVNGERDVMPDLTDYPDLAEGDRNDIGQMNFIVTLDQRTLILDTLALAKQRESLEDTDNKNSNGNALEIICASYANR